MAYITVDDLSYQYDKEPILEDITLEINPSEFVVLTGENGSAKSTLIKNMLGILEPFKGTTKLAKKNTESKTLITAYIKQDVTQYNASFPSTVYQLVASGRYPNGKWFKSLDKNDKAIIQDALEKVDMWQYQDQSVGELSGGQKQRVQLARAFAMQPDLYVLDEPTTGMDDKSRQEMYQLLKTETERGNAVLMVTHDNDEWMNVADRHIRLVRKEDTPWRCFNLISLDGPL